MTCGSTSKSIQHLPFHLLTSVAPPLRPNRWHLRWVAGGARAPAGSARDPRPAHSRWKRTGPDPRGVSDVFLKVQSNMEQPKSLNTIWRNTIHVEHRTGVVLKEEQTLQFRKSCPCDCSLPLLAFDRSPQSSRQSSGSSRLERVLEGDWVMVDS